MTDIHTPHSLALWLGYLSLAEVDFLTRLTVGLPPDSMVVNIGAGGGTSALTFLSARDDLRLFTIDRVREITPVGGLENERLILEAAGLANGRYQAVHGDSARVGMDWDRGLLDMIFVDGDHSYMGCWADLEAWWPRLKRGGILAVHDYLKTEHYRATHPGEELTPDILVGVVKPYPGVDRAVKAFIEQHAVSFVDTVDTLIALRKEIE